MATTSEEAEAPWEELLGSNNWDTLLDPLNLSLRQLILRCGDFCQAAHDAFNSDQYSKYCGSSRYCKSTFFHKVMLESASDYVVSSFLYATARLSLPESFLLHSKSREKWDRESNWVGYIAVTSDARTKALGRREIYVVWRGTNRKYEWVDVLGAELTSAECLLHPITDQSKLIKSDSGGGNMLGCFLHLLCSCRDDDKEKTPKVMLGWLTLYISDDSKSQFTKQSARTQLLSRINSLIEQYKNENPSIIFTGHSLGASLSIISAMDVAENVTDDIPVAAFVFGCPRVGNKAFKERIERHKNLNILHIRNAIDFIPHYPIKLLGYVYIGTELVIDTRKSNCLKKSKNPGDWHNLQALLHVVAGWNGEKGEFELKVKRSLALVNKSSDFLKDEYSVPGSWWVEKNKGLVRNEDGEWLCAPPDDDDMPVP
ncbi:hypothetical protein SLA2020_508750 [Shorea laevis]